MEKETIVEGNRLIAEFMGYKFNAYPELKHTNITNPDETEWFYASWVLDDFNEYVSNYFKYHTSFDWLMPVVQKINNWHTETMCEKMDFYLLNQSICSSIEMVWSGVIEFITWYNTQPPAGQ